MHVKLIITMTDLKISLIQADLHWENIDENLQLFSQKIAAIAEATDLIVLPEMFSTGFSMRPSIFAENMNGKTVKWMATKAAEKNCVITGSFICEENGKYFNRLIWMKPDGTYSTYDKRHLFRMANEDNHYSPGENKIIVELKGWKICPLICYDLRFPVWSRQQLAVDNKQKEKSPQYQYDVLIYVANWPERRAHPWKTLLMARAIENQCYVVGLNRVGDDGNKIEHSGDSAVINAKGEVISTIRSKQESTETVTLNFEELKTFRKSFPAIMDADDFEIRP